MKNYEKYADKIKNFTGNFCKDFIEPYILKAINNAKCYDISCSQCEMLRTLWLLEEYKEPEIDWSKVEIDTPILVKDMEYEKWFKRYFAEYKDGVVYAWINGKTSWTAEGDITEWEYAKLAKEEESDE